MITGERAPLAPDMRRTALPRGPMIAGASSWPRKVTDDVVIAISTARARELAAVWIPLRIGVNANNSPRRRPLC